MQPVITIEQYAGKYINHPDWTLARENNARALLVKVNKILLLASAWVELKPNPKTGSLISGDSNGGFRPLDCSTGAPQSNHKQGLGVDVFDPRNLLDIWCLMNVTKLENEGIWLEHPLKTDGWSHMQSVSPKSGNRFYLPG
jgi:hypothetical protein